jgi:hypothetical protein
MQAPETESLKYPDIILRGDHFPFPTTRRVDDGC